MRSAWCISFPSVLVWIPASTQKITTIPYHFISTLLNVNSDFDDTVANDVTFDVAKRSLPGKVMQWSPCLEVHTLTNENGRYMIKLNDSLITTCFVTFQWWELKQKHNIPDPSAQTPKHWHFLGVLKNKGPTCCTYEDNALAGYNQNCDGIPSSWSKEASLYKNRGFSLSFGLCFFCISHCVIILFLWWNNCTFIIMSNSCLSIYIL